MDKKTALKILIEHSYFLTLQIKKKLLDNIDNMSDSDVDDLGKFLATEKKIAIEKNTEMIADLENLTKSLQEELKKGKKK